METLAGFVERLSKDVGCFSHRLKSGLYPLKRNNTMQRGRMDVFGFVKELRDKFRIHTSKDDANTANVFDLFDGSKDNLWFGAPGSFIFVEKGSNGEAYQKAITAFKTIMNSKNLRINFS